MAENQDLKLSFSTQACPEWTVAAIVDGMQSYGFDGVELVLGKGHKHNVDVDSPAAHLTEVRKQMDDAEMGIACLSGQLSLSVADKAARLKVLDELKKTLTLADRLGVPYVRIFGGNIPGGFETAGVIDYIAEALADAAEYIETSKLRSMLLLQTHDIFSHSKYALEVLSQVYSEYLGILWDVLHPLRVMETVEQTYESLGKYVRMLHIHDCSVNDDRTRIAPCTLGEGFVPFTRVVKLLKADNFHGYLSLESLQQEVDPDEMLPHGAEYLKKLIVHAKKENKTEDEE